MEPLRKNPDFATSVQRAFRFFVALGLLIYEATLYRGEPRWILIVVYGAMMGLPLVNMADDARQALLRGQPRPPAEEGE